MENNTLMQPDHELREKIEMWRQKRAAFTATAVGMYIAGVAVLCGIPGIAALRVDWSHVSDPALEGIVIGRYSLMGFIIFLVIAAVATGMLVYVNMSIPADVAAYLGKKSDVETAVRISGDSTGARLARTWLGCHTPVAVIIYFVISFATRAWHITWLVFLVDVALVNALKSFFGEENDEEE